MADVELASVDASIVFDAADAAVGFVTAEVDRSFADLLAGCGHDIVDWPSISVITLPVPKPRDRKLKGRIYSARSWPKVVARAEALEFLTVEVSPCQPFDDRHLIPSLPASYPKSNLYGCSPGPVAIAVSFDWEQSPNFGRVTTSCPVAATGTVTGNPAVAAASAVVAFIQRAKRCEGFVEAGLGTDQLVPELAQTRAGERLSSGVVLLLGPRATDALRTATIESGRGVLPSEDGFTFIQMVKDIDAGLGATVGDVFRSIGHA